MMQANIILPTVHEGRQMRKLRSSRRQDDRLIPNSRKYLDILGLSLDNS
jgi:hypothetical protein